MTTFQAIIYAIIHGFTQFLPVSASAHERLVPYLLNWGDHPPAGALMAALYLGSTLAVLAYFIHDWASIISSFLQVIFFRKKPMTLDERLPLFLFCTGIPLALAYVYLRPLIEQVDWDNPLWVAGVLAVGAIPLWLAERGSRKNKGMFDWNWLDAFIVGVTGILMFVPGGGMPEGLAPGAMFRNYNREAAVKYAYFVMFPILIACCYKSFGAVSIHGGPADDLSWLSFGVAAVVSFFSSLLAIGGLTKHVQRGGFGQYVIYRILVAGVVFGVYALRNR